MRTQSHTARKWRIEPHTDIITGERKWKTTPPRWIYRPHAEGKKSHDTYDQALAHVYTSRGRRPVVFESKTHTGHYFWLNTEGGFGWEKDRAKAHNKADGIGC